MKRICLISPSHPCSNPRLVKEADALAGAGFDVHVICSRYMPALDAFDAGIFAKAQWNCTVVDHTARTKRLYYSLARRIARASDGLARRLPLLAHHPPARDLIEPASRIRADLYVGHVLGGLPVAVAAAKKNRALAGFDAEDFHSAEIPDTPENRRDLIARRQLERLLRFCADRTAAAPCIAEAYQASQGVAMDVILNVFPLAMAPAAPAAREAADDAPVRFYWFSQTVGTGRGLEAFLEAMRHATRDWRLHLRGHVSAGTRASLDGLGGGKIVWEPPAGAEEMARLAAACDVGLSLEESLPLNRDLCLTNKIFTCLLAGLPIILSPTTAQRRLARDLGDAAVVVDFTQPAEAARAIAQFAFDPARLRTARAKSWELGQTVYNWDREKTKRIASVRSLLASAAPTP